MDPVTLKRSKIRAPQLDGHYLVSPNSELTQWIASNHALLERPVGGDEVAASSQDFLSSLRSVARQELIQAAIDHTRQYASGNLEVLSDSAAIYLTGHQPEMFHPGVWFKNFLLHALGQQTQSTTINLIIDNDESQSSIAVPGGKLSNPHLQQIEFDTPQTGVPFETCHWQDQDTIQSFESRTEQFWKSLTPYQWILTPYWKLVMQAQQDQSELGLCLARARHQLELAHGLQNLEVPLSVVCQSQSFAQFVAELLTRAESFHQVYNESLQLHRSANRIRSQSRPVPELTQHGDWLELPFWIWTTDQRTRSRLYLKTGGQDFEISDLGEIHCSLSIKNLAEQLFELEAQRGISIRPRALMTTLYARIFLCDLFIHGIGGAKYDELTDLIIERFFGICPPHYLTATSTHLLPLGIEPFDESQLVNLSNEERERRFHPEKFLSDHSGLEAEWEEKNRLLSDIPPRGKKRKWHVEMERVNHALLQPQLAELRALQDKYEDLKETRRISQLLGSREFSFVLHPLSLIDQLIELSENAAANLIDC